jgi:hypothetical protein
MIYHIVRFALADDLSGEERDECLRMLTGLGDMDSVVSAEVCQDLGDPESGFTHSVVVVLSGEEQYRPYQVDPFHVEVIAYVIPRFKKMMICDAATDLDPGLYGRLMKAQEESPAITPEIVAHMERISA